MRSGSFDQAASDYDAARGFPPGIAETVVGAALEWLGSARCVLEIGVGTGRIARPLLDRRVAVVGVDLSRAMMDQLLLQLPPGAWRPPLIQGDALCLPLASGAFDAVVTVHVLHLLSDWQAALSEARRVLRPGSALLSGYDWRPPHSPGARLLARWRELLAAAGLVGSGGGGRDFPDIQAALLASGAQVEERTVGEWTVARTLARQIETIEHRTWALGAEAPVEVYRRCLAELRSWAAATFGGLDRSYSVAHRFVWQCYRWLTAEHGG